MLTELRIRNLAIVSPLVVRPGVGSLIDENYADLAAKYGGFPEAADWMSMGALEPKTVARDVATTD